MATREPGRTAFTARRLRLARGPPEASIIFTAPVTCPASRKAPLESMIFRSADEGVDRRRARAPDAFKPPASMATSLRSTPPCGNRKAALPTAGPYSLVAASVTKPLEPSGRRMKVSVMCAASRGRRGTSRASKSASRSARGSASVPVMAPEPLALPVISTGPARNGPSADQSSLNFSAPFSRTPALVALTAAPFSSALARDIFPSWILPLADRLGDAPSSRSSSANPEANPAPLASADRVQGLPGPPWVALQVADAEPLAPVLAAARLETSARPLKLRPPISPRPPLACTFKPAPVASRSRRERRPSARRWASKLALGLAPRMAARTPVPCPPAPLACPFTLRTPALRVSCTGPLIRSRP
jgi:hypothetical protein